MIYEPMGPTGDRRIPVRFAIPGQAELPFEVFDEFLNDLQAFKLRLGKQKRQAYARLNFVQRWTRQLIGSRTRISYWAAKLGPRPDILIWKDPMASFAIPAVLSRGVPTVLCIRSPLAHAASFKRKGWKVDIAAIYPNFRSCYGAIPEIEKFTASNRITWSVASASMLWHMVYSLAYRTSRGEFGQPSAPLMLISGTELEADEIEVYRQTYEALGLPFEGRPRRSLEARAGQAVADSGGPTKTHDWRRSVSATNSYWKQTLNEAEIEFVQKLNAPIFDKLENINASGRAASRSEAPLAVAED
jgi:hypothetical protein